jgi:hypothetical protein
LSATSEIKIKNIDHLGAKELVQSVEIEEIDAEEKEKEQP